MKHCTFPPHYTTYSGSGIPCPACGESSGFDAVPRDLLKLQNTSVFAEVVGAVALVLSVLVLAAFLIGGGNR